MTPAERAGKPASSAETPFVLALLAVAVLASLPAATGLFSAPHATSWTGILTRNTADTNVYLSLIEEIRRDGLLAHDLYTAEPHSAFQCRPCYILIGLAGRLLPAVSTLVLFEAGRFVASVLLLSIVSVIIAGLFREPGERLMAFFVVSLGSGLGWTSFVRDSPDLIAPESSTFLTLVAPPHFPLSLALLLAIFWAVQKAWTEPATTSGRNAALLAGILGLWLGLEHPFDLVPLAIAVTGVLLIDGIRKQSPPFTLLLRALPLAAGAGIAIAVQAILLHTIPIYTAWNRQNITPSPPVLTYLWSLGLLIPLAIYGAKRSLASAPLLSEMLLMFVGASFICSRLPFRWQWRFLEGLPAALAMASACGLIRCISEVSNKTRRAYIAILAIALLIPSNIVSIARDIQTLARHSPPQYLPDSLIEGMRTVGALAAPGEAILSSELAGNFVPAYSAKPVVLGHQIQTMNVDEKRALVASIFAMSAGNRQTQSLINRTGAKWFFWSSLEASLAEAGFDPEMAPYLKREFHNNAVSIYRVR
jgi:hypothetical protein